MLNYSIIIPTRNEVRDLEVTVAMVWASNPRPYEIIVVDDCGEDDVEQRLSSFDGVRVVRTPKRLGAGGAKRFGGELATGDVIVLMDSHMRMPYDWLKIANDALEVFTNAIFCCGCQNFSRKWTGCGSKFIAGALKQEPDLFASQTWLTPNKEISVDTCPCLLGGCYFIPRFIWEVLGGLNPCTYGWGYEEQDLSLRAWITGFEVRRINNLVIQHRFQKELEEKKDNEFPETFADYNAMVVCASIFEDGVFEKLYYPFFKQIAPVKAIIDFEDRIDEINGFRKFVQAKRTYNDEDLPMLCGFRPPTQHEQRTVVELIKTKRAKSQAKYQEEKANKTTRKCKGCSKEKKVSA